MNQHTTRKHAVILALIVSAILFLPATSFAKGAVIGYAPGYRNAPNAAQLDRLTHVMAFSVFPNANGSLITSGHLPTWLSSFVTSAHAKGVKVSIAVGGWSNDYTPNFITATNNTNRGTFVTNIVNLVNQYNLDGVDIDWEYPKDATQWGQCIALLNDLRAKLPCKRLSIALPGYTPTTSWFFQNQNIPRDIWEAVDFIHLMTYDMNPEWNPHSNAANSNALIDTWATWGSSGGRNLDKEKLVIGCAFYGNVPNVRTYAEGATDSDTPASLKTKVDHCYDKGYGGAMIWELGQDANISSTPTLLSAIWNATTAKGGYSIITINAQPAASTPVTQGSITGNLSVTASTKSCVDELTYQWYQNTAPNTTGGTAVSGATNASFPIPATLGAGTFNYYCEVKSGKCTIKSTVATVTVTAADNKPIISTTTLPGGTVGTAYNATLAATGNTPITWTLDGGNLPTAGLTLASNGAISGTPTAAGKFTFTVKATNSSGSDTKELSIDIANAVLTITTTGLPNGTVDKPYNATLAATGSGLLTWSLDSSTLPSGLNLAANGVISGTPTVAGKITFTVKVDNTWATDIKELSILINEAGSVTSSAKGIVTGYVTSEPTAAQLDRVTHVLVFQASPDASGNLTGAPGWLNGFVTAAHAKNVKVSIGISGGSFATATNNTNRANFVNKIAEFVTLNNLDGVDINWRGHSQWDQHIALLKELKAHKDLQCKRITVDLDGAAPTVGYPNENVPAQIWETVDGIHLMTANNTTWPTHSDAGKATEVIDAWADWNPDLDRGKLMINCAFYGTKPTADISYADGATDSDNATSLTDKVSHCYDKEYGGVTIWQLSQDKNITTAPELLSVIWNLNNTKGGYSVISINAQPTFTSVTVGSISGSLSVEASATCETLSYQWYQAANSSEDGTSIYGATGASFPIPTTLTEGTYYYYCVVSGTGKVSPVRSNAAEVEVIFYTNIDEISATQTPVQIYPNPVSTELYIEFASSETADYAIYNNVGQIVMQGKLQGSSIINVQSLPNGIYHLRTSGQTMKLIKN